MALVVADRVKETTSTAGTGAVSLAGAELTFVTFSSVMSDGDTTYYTIVDNTNSEFEVGLGTYASSGNTLTRTTIFSSSNSNNAVNFQAGPKDVFLTYPADKSVRLDANGKIAENQTFAGTVTLNADPSSGLQAATKQYVDDTAAEGIQYHSPVRVEREGNLSATYDNGTAGVGATLTNNSTQAALVIDGVTLSVNDRVLIYEQTDQTENGIYTVTNTGSASTNWVLTRATDADSYAPSDPNALAQGSGFFVQEGTAGAGEKYVCNTVGTITFGTTNITFVQVATAQIYTAGTGISINGSVISSDATLDEVTTSGATTSNAITVGNLTSTGIDDNASSTALTISSAGASTFSGDVILSESTPRLDFFDTDVTDSNFRVAMAGATTYVRSRGGTSSYGQFRFQRNNDGSTNLSVFGTTTGGDVIFYDDDGSTEGLRWDASTSRLGLSDGTPATMLQVGNSGTEDSNAYITFGKRVASTETNLPFIGQDDYDGGGHNDLGLGAGSTNGTINFYTGNAAAFTAAKRRMSIAANGDVTIANDVDISGNLTAGDGTNISMGTLSPGQLRLDGSGYAGAIALDATGMHIYHNSASRSIIFGTNETEQMRLDTNGDLGVGSDNPLARLHVKLTAGTTGETDPLARFERFTTGDNHYLDVGVDNANNLVSFKSTGTSDGGFKFENAGNELVSITSLGTLRADPTNATAGLSSLSVTNNAFTIGDYTDFNLAFDSNEIQARNNGAANTLILNKSGGDVGIGIAPIYNLHIHENSSGGCWAMFSNSTTGSSSGNGALVGLDSSEEFNIRVYENEPIDFWTNNTQRMRIANDGNIGIRTASSAPQKELQINLASTTTTTLGSKGGIELYAASSTVGNGGEITWMSGSGTTERWCAISGHITTNTADGSVGDLIIATKNATTGTTLTERLRVSSGGTVTISNGSGSGSNGNLTLAGSSSGNEGGQLNLNTVSSGTYSIDTHTDNMRFLNGTTAGDYLWYKNSNSAVGMTLTGAGDLAIGTTTAVARLSVNAGGSPDAQYGIANFAAGSGVDSYVTVSRGGNDQGGIKILRGSVADLSIYVNSAESSIINYNGGDTSDGLFFRRGSAGTDVMSLNANGDVDMVGSLTVGDGTSTASHIAIKPADDTDADDLQFYNGTTRIGEIGTQDTTWLRINQETAKNIYTPRYIRADGGFFVDGTSKGLNGAGNLIGSSIETTGTVVAGPSTTGGSAAYSITYSGNDILNVFGGLRSSGNTVLTYGAKPSTTVNGGYISAADNFAFSKAALEIGGGTLEFKKSASGTDTVGNALTMTNVFSIDTAGDATFTGSVQTEGPDGGLILRTWPGGSTYGMLGTANMSGAEYALLTDGTNTFIAGGAGGSVYIRNGANDASPQMQVGPSNITFNGSATGGNFLYKDTTQDITGHKEFQDDVELRFGNSADVRMEYRASGADFYCRSYSHGTRLLFQGEDSSGSNKALVYMDPDDATSLYHTGSLKGYTYSSGWRVTGNLLATSDVYAYYSDERLKDKTGKIENALDKVGAIETFYYTHNDKAIELGYEDKKQQVGVSAQSVEAVMPEVVHLAPIDDDGKGNSVSGEDYKTVNYARLVPLLIESIKELRAEIEALKGGV